MIPIQFLFLQFSVSVLLPLSMIWFFYLNTKMYVFQFTIYYLRICVVKNACLGYIFTGLHGRILFLVNGKDRNCMLLSVLKNEFRFVCSFHHLSYTCKTFYKKKYLEKLSSMHDLSKQSIQNILLCNVAGWWYFPLIGASFKNLLASGSRYKSKFIKSLRSFRNNVSIGLPCDISVSLPLY